MVGLGVSVTAHLILIGLIVLIAVPAAARSFLPDAAGPPQPSGAGGPGEFEAAPTARASLRAWRETRTLLVGVFVLAFAFAEGAGNDWISLATIDRHHVAPAVGTLVFATFLGAMTTARWFGPAVLDRYGRVAVARVLVVMAIAGLVLFIFGPGIGLAVVGALLWGTGTSLGFPMGMSAAADEPALAAPRVGVVTTIGYSAFLAGPPLIGFLGQRFSVPHALIAVVVALVIAGAIAGSVRPLRPPVEQTSN
jgi:MFS family permease